jgi:hypothetical protein
MTAVDQPNSSTPFIAVRLDRPDRLAKDLAG